MKNKKGFTLVEILIVTGLIMTMTVGVFLTYKKQQEYLTLNKYDSFLIDTSKNVDNYFMNMPTSVIGLTVGQAINGNLIDTDYINGGAIVHPWNGNMAFGVRTVLTANDAIGYTLTNVPLDVCLKLGIGNFANKVNRITINGILTMAAPPMNAATVTAVNTNCINATANTIIFDKILEKPHL